MNDRDMKHDGAKYLCYIEYPEMYVPGEYHDGGVEYHKESGIKDWVVLHWGNPCAFSDVKQRCCWITFNKMALKIKNILCYFDVEELG